MHVGVLERRFRALPHHSTYQTLVLQNFRFVSVLVPYPRTVLYTETCRTISRTATHYIDNRLVNYQPVMVVRIFRIAIWSVTSDIFPCSASGLPHRLNLVARISGEKIIHHIFENHQHFIIVLNGVHAVLQGYEATADACPVSFGKLKDRLYRAS